MKTLAKPAAKPKSASKKTEDVSASYNKIKHFGGKQYTGMSIGRSHKWYYDKGEWKDSKITPDLWSISYSVTKRRAGKAPKGSGAAVGTGYHWFIFAHQNVEKLNADDYSTSLNGLKFKLAHKRADKGKWNTTASTQRKHLITFLKEMITQLEKAALPINIEHKGEVYKGEAIPVIETFFDGLFHEFELTLNNEYKGIIRKMKSSWKMEMVKDQKLVNTIGEELTRLSAAV